MNPTSESGIITVAALFVLFALPFIAISIMTFISEANKRLRTLGVVNAKLDLLLENSGLKFDPYKGLPREVAEAVQRGKKVQAIKSYRRHTGVSLREAADFIEKVQWKAGV